MNILFVMYDQLRFDYLSCAGHPTLQTPHFDRVAQMGVRFTRAYAPSTICGSSRMSFYTGRYTSSHGAGRNNYPLRVGEITLGDHLRDAGMDAFLVGKTHMVMDSAGMQRMGLTTDSIIGARVAQTGFDVVIRDDGLWPQGVDGIYNQTYSPYNAYLQSKGYDSPNPWHDFANSAVGPDGEILSGWLMTHSNLPANVRNEDSETPWLTQQFIDWLEDSAPDSPWLCHLSYIKPHWPYIAPAPYHDLYGPMDVKPVNRDTAEKHQPHPVFDGYQQTQIGRSFSQAATRDKAIPAYMGLIKQCDDELGRLLNHLETTGQMDSTMIVLTSDHGDYLGDHWMGEKDLFHDCSVKIPLIIYDPRANADATRGSECDALVEGIDLAATFVEIASGQVPSHVIEGRSLQPFLRGETPDNWREFVISEYDYAPTDIARSLELTPDQARIVMVANTEYKLIHFEGGLPPMLFDLVNDPDELTDLGQDPNHQGVVEQMRGYMHQWSMRQSQRTALSDERINQMGQPERKGVLRGLYDGSELPSELIDPIRGRVKRMT